MSLSSDIQRALQLAVGEANNAFVQSQTRKTSRKKRASPDNEPLDKPRKKKKKPAVEEDQPQAQTELESQPTLTSQDLSGDNNHASAAFLNAVVAAASATSSDSQPLDLSQFQHHPSYHDPMIPEQQPSYLPYHLAHYGFPEVPPFDHPPHSQPQQLFPGLGGPLPDFQYASNDDILRAIQDMDMSKIATVLKTLGDAAAAANGSVPNPPPPGFVPPPPPNADAVQPLAHTPSTSSVGVLSTAPKSTKSSHKRVLDMSLPGPEPANQEHAHMLANKWMNASKLAELVKTQGLRHYVVSCHVVDCGARARIQEGKVLSDRRAATQNGHRKLQNRKSMRQALHPYSRSPFFRQSRAFSDDQILEIIFQKNEKGKDNTFWSEISK